MAPRRGTTRTGSRPGPDVRRGEGLSPTGKPVPNATVMAYASLKWHGRGDGLLECRRSRSGRRGVTARAGSGWMRLRTTSSRHYQVGAVAIAPGYGAGWVELDPDAGQPVADITLRPEQVIQGRLFDVQGRPAQGVEVSVESMGTIVAGSPDMTLSETEGPYFFRVGGICQPGPSRRSPTPTAGSRSGAWAGTFVSASRSITRPSPGRGPISIPMDSRKPKT